MGYFKNWSIANLAAGGISAGASSLTVTAGAGSKFPTTFPYMVPIWDSTNYASPNADPNHEVVLFTGRPGSADTFSIVRGRENTSAVAHNTADTTYTVFAGPTESFLNVVLVGGWKDFELVDDSTDIVLPTFPDQKFFTLRLVLRQDEVGGRLVVWPENILWDEATITADGSSAPLLQDGANGVDVVELVTSDGGDTFLGMHIFSAPGVDTDFSVVDETNDPIEDETDDVIVYKD